MLRIIFTAFLAWHIASPLAAEELSDLSPEQLQAAAVGAVETSDEQRLMAVMKEMQTRQLLFFSEAADETCEREPDRVGLLQSKPFAWGNARQAYFTFLRQQRLENGDCGCLTNQMTFDAFATQMFGATAATMSESQYQELLDFKNENESATSSAYRDHVTLNCAGE